MSGFPAPPKKKSAGGHSERSVFNQYINAHPNMKPYAQAIWNSAHEFGLDAVYFSAMLWTEGFQQAAARHVDVSTITSSAGAIGPGQIMPSHIGQKTSWGATVTPQNIRNATFNIRYAADYFSQGFTGNYEQHYENHYNPGYHGNAFGTVPKSYVPTGGLTPTQRGQQSAETSAATAQAKGQNPYLQGQAFLQEKQRIDTIYEAYTGHRATNGQARHAIEQNWSDYHLELLLTRSPRFVGSPIWQAHAPGYKDTFHQIYGEDKKPAPQLIAYAIIHNLDGAGFADLLRQRKDYVQSNEFKTNSAGLENVYRKIYGTPDDKGIATIQRAALSGWNSDQFADYLRKQPEYSSSQELGSGVMGLLQALGGVTGQGVVMRPGAPPPQEGPAAPAPRPDQRVGGPAGIGVKGPQYEPGLS